MQHAKAGNGVFASRVSGKKVVARSYYGSLASGDFGREPRTRWPYWERCMEVTAESFGMSAVDLERKVSGSQVQDCSVWVLLAPLSAARYIKSLRYLEANREGAESRD